jgi:hypothetical protein
MDGKEKGLQSHTIAFMIMTALFFDFLQFLLSFIWMGWLVGLFAGFTFWWWFRQHGISFSKPSQWGSFALAFIIEVIPVVGDLPAWTLEVGYLAISSKAKEIVADNVPGAAKAINATQKVYSFKNGRGRISTEAAEDEA